MSLQDSTIEIFKRLQDWSRHPKYALERRLDIFLTPLLAEFVAGQRGLDPSQVTLVLPEFPLRHRAANHRTVNADYLLYDRSGNRWLLVELKTDKDSVDPDQLARYRKACSPGRTMARALATLKQVRRRTEASKRVKYARAIRLIQELDSAFQEPKPLRGSFDFLYLAPADADVPRDRHIQLEALGKWRACPARHDSLRLALVELLEGIKVVNAADQAMEQTLKAQDQARQRAKAAATVGRRRR